MVEEGHSFPADRRPLAGLAEMQDKRIELYRLMRCCDYLQ